MLKEHDRVPNSFPNEIERYTSYITAGDDLCVETNQNDIFALYGITRLAERISSEGGDLPKNVIHILRQLKRVDEIKSLNMVYGRNILFVGCYAPESERMAYLVKKMLKTERAQNKTKLEAQALEIISTDEDEKDKPHGQKIIDCYPYSDYVLDCTSRSTLKASCQRLVKIYFGHPFVSPDPDEYCSYIANAASYRSLDLSRQVGAAIFGNDCEIISMGCNEVPKAGGGTYWSCGHADKRDYAIGYDSNQRVREDMTRDALNRLSEGGWLKEEYKNLNPDQLVERAFNKDQDERGPLYGSMIADVIEYGRMVHAEMNALADAARFRKSTQDATLYCTTMPCHMCTKLIIAAGIKRVVYIQPYGKSLTEELYDDSVVVESKPDKAKVNFETLKGVTPNSFKRAFQKQEKRKNDDGSIVRWDGKKASPSFLSTYEYYVLLESKAVERFQDKLSIIDKRKS